MTLVPEATISELYRELHKAAYDVYEQCGPVLEDELHNFAPIALKRMMPILEELARAGAYRSRDEEVWVGGSESSNDERRGWCA